MKKTFSGILVAALAFAGVVGTSTKADAAFIAAICQDLTCSSGPIIVTDNGAGDTIPGTGAINFSMAAFGYSLVVNTSQSKPVHRLGRRAAARPHVHRHWHGDDFPLRQ